MLTVFYEIEIRNTYLLFFRHLRENHCKKEGGSYVCTYGENNVCNSLPIEGVNDSDYEKHVYKHHAMSNANTSSDSEKLQTSAWNIYSASQNLPAVLNDPSKGKQKDLFTKTWGDHFVEVHNVPTPSYLPEISIHHFDNYLKKISKRCRRRRLTGECLYNYVGIHSSNFHVGIFLNTLGHYGMV